MDQQCSEPRRHPPDTPPVVVDELLYQPLMAAEGRYIIARSAQSLDGYIATRDGESCWISGTADIVHTHRLRSLCDAVVVGAGTVQADDPQLTTRLVQGPHAIRVVLDPERRLEPRFQVFRGGPPTLLLCAPDAKGPSYLGSAEVITVPRGPLGLDIAAIIDTLAARGLRRILIEGGGITVSRFLVARALDRLHVTVAPLLMGGGIPAFPLPPVGQLAEGRRFGWTVHRLGDDVLLDIPLTPTP